MGKKYDLIVESVNNIFAEYNTRMSLRQIYYRLVAKLIIPNTINEYKNLSRLLVKARERGAVDYRMIEDRARTSIGGDRGRDQVDFDNFIQSYEDVFRDCWEYFNLSMWHTQPNYIEVWIEKDALSRVVSDAAENFRVRTCPSKGYSSFSYIMDAVHRINKHDEKNCTIFYAGDYDPSGLDITRDLRDRLHRYGADVTVKRIALSLDQINEHQLPPMPAKKSDARYAKFVADTGGADAVELDALEPPVLKQIVKAALMGAIDFDAWNKRIQEIKEGKRELKKRLEKMQIVWEDE